MPAKRVGKRRADLSQRAGEDGDLPENDSVEAQAGDLACDPVCLLGGMAEGAADELRFAFAGGDKLLAEVGVDVALDDARRELDDLRRRAVVRRQVVTCRAGPALGEAERVVDLGPAEAVDRLVLVRDAEDVSVLAGEQLQQPVLSDVRVLVLVYQDVAERLLVGAAGVVALLEQRDRLALEAAVVKPGELGQVARANSRERMVGQLEVVIAELGEAEGFLDKCIRPAQAQVALGGQRCLHRPSSSGRAGQGRLLGSLAGEQREREGVEGRDREARVAALESGCDPFAKVGRRLARKCEHEQLLGSRTLLVDQANGALDDDARLPGARAGEHDRRPVAVRDSRPLVRV